jgi:hypothetical protein
MAEQERPRGRRARKSKQRQKREELEAQRRKRYMMFGGAIAAAVLIIVVLSILTWPDSDDNDFPPVQAASAAYENIPQEPYSLGDPDAPVHLIEWSDYQ